MLVLPGCSGTHQPRDWYESNESMVIREGQTRRQVAELCPLIEGQTFISEVQGCTVYESVRLECRLCA